MRILISPLDWGLGHATRCIPVIHSFLQNGCEVYIACNTTQQRLLEKEFSGVHFLPLAGYNIRYASSKRWFAVKILQQIPKILLAIYSEHRWLKMTAKKYSVSLIISDNRFGFYHKKIPSVFITHQLFIQTPDARLSRWVQQINYRFIERFRECLVPDYKGEPNLAGILSHPEKLPSLPVSYLGLLSRFQKSSNENYKYKWLIILSGPEPQRTLLEKVMIDKLSVLTEPVLLVRGLPISKENLAPSKHITVFNHLSTNELAEAFAQSEYIISRSGYTTVMDIISLQKKSILIPTPGQTEQEYLAEHLAKQQWCIACSQPDLLNDLLTSIERFDYRLPTFSGSDINDFVRNAIRRLRVTESDLR